MFPSKCIFTVSRIELNIYISQETFFWSGDRSVGNVLDFFANWKNYIWGPRVRTLPPSEIFEIILMFIPENHCIALLFSNVFGAGLKFKFGYWTKKKKLFSFFLTRNGKFIKILTLFLLRVWDVSYQYFLTRSRNMDKAIFCLYGFNKIKFLGIKFFRIFSLLFLCYPYFLTPAK